MNNPSLTNIVPTNTKVRNRNSIKLDYTDFRELNDLKSFLIKSGYFGESLLSSLYKTGWSIDSNQDFYNGLGSFVRVMKPSEIKKNGKTVRPFINSLD